MFARLVAAILLAAAIQPAAATEEWRQTGENAYKGHRLATFVDDAARRGMLKLDDREFALPEPVTEIGKIGVLNAETTILFWAPTKLVQGGCGSYVLLSVPAADTGRGDLLSSFGACNSRLSITVRQRKGWGAWYAIAFRDDLATAQVALRRNAAIAVERVTALPCLFATAVANDCAERLIAAAYGSEERGLLTGDGAFGDARIETYLNRATGKATIALNGNPLRTFDGAADFYLESVNHDAFGVFSLFLRPAAQGCSTRPLMFFPARNSEPQVVADFAPCADRMLRTMQTNKDKTVVAWHGIAYRVGDPNGFIASVIGGKLTTRAATLPACMVVADSARTADCLRQALHPSAGATPEPSTTPVPPRPAPSPGPAGKPRTVPI